MEILSVSLNEFSQTEHTHVTNTPNTKRIVTSTLETPHDSLPAVSPPKGNHSSAWLLTYAQSCKYAHPCLISLTHPYVCKVPPYCAELWLIHSHCWLVFQCECATIHLSIFVLTCIWVVSSLGILPTLLL